MTQHTLERAFSDLDFAMMSRAIKLAKRGIYTTAPNPNVGCVIVRDEEIVGEG
ncbi:bifunctional diaminohydroxyphosphoribosylaminopyrimidine deaminase/5-amino-6-(5-phosphoribosylamino)uracil reductase, partial [Vibrio alginolyticus]